MRLMVAFILTVMFIIVPVQAGFLIIDCQAHGVQAGGYVVVEGRSYAQYPDGTFPITPVQGVGIIAITLVNGNAGQNETQRVVINDGAYARVQFVGNAAVSGASVTNDDGSTGSVINDEAPKDKDEKDKVPSEPKEPKPEKPDKKPSKAPKA